MPLWGGQSDGHASTRGAYPASYFYRDTNRATDRYPYPYTFSETVVTAPIKELPVVEIEAAQHIQVRVRLDDAVVADYSEAMLGGGIFPPIVVFSPNGSERYILADGFHRLEAARKGGLDSIACEIHDGGPREALGYALGANSDHGLRRSNRDKRHACELALTDTEWGAWSNSDVAALCRVSDKTVAKVREELVLAGEIEEQKTIKTRQRGRTVQRKAKNERVSEIRNGSRLGPKTQDEVDAEEFFGLLDHVRTLSYDGANAAERFSAEKRWADVEFVHEWLGEMLEAIETRAGQKRNGESQDGRHDDVDIPF